MSRTITITAPCRLHFGLLRFAEEEGLSYGGLGMMLDQPATVVEMQRAETWQATGPNADRALAFAQQASRTWDELSPLSIHIRKTPPAHAGLGSGTQLALAVARGVAYFGNRQAIDIGDLSNAVGRGQRSAIGSHGFLHGGLLWETGRTSNESLGKLSRRLEVPAAWRVLLIVPSEDAGLHGSAEIDAFAQLPSVPVEVTEKLQRLAEENILPAVEQADFEKFSESLYQYGHLAGSCFASVQGGSYASSKIADGINNLRSLGLQGVGQSSWGPTIFAFIADVSSANHWRDRLLALPEFADSEITIAAPNNRGATCT